MSLQEATLDYALELPLQLLHSKALGIQPAVTTFKDMYFEKTTLAQASVF